MKKTVNDIVVEVDSYCEGLIESIQELQRFVDDLDIVDGINDVDNFIWKLKSENLYTPELEKFIKDYMRYHNE